MLRPPVSAARAALAALIAAASLTSEVGGAVEGGLGDFLNIPDSGLESPLGVREGFNFVTKPSTSSFFIAQQTMAVSFLHCSTLWGVRSVVMFCKTFLECSIGCWVVTAAIVQPNWYRVV